MLVFGAASDIAAQNLPCPDAVCFGDATPTVYTVPNTAGSTYQWVVTGGNITSGQGTNTITVDWSTTPVGGYNVSVTETTSANCVGTPVNCAITVDPLPTTGVITHD